MEISRDYGLVDSVDSLEALINKLTAENKPIGFDVETGYSGPARKHGSLYIDWDAQFVCGFSITNSPEWARYVPVAHDWGGLGSDAWEIVKPALETLPVIAHHMKFEKRNLRALARKARGPRININAYGDSILQSYVLSESPLHGLKPLVKRIFGHEQAEIESLFPGTPKNAMETLRFNVLETTPEVWSYACEDAAWCLALHQYFEPKIASHPARSRIYALEMKIFEILCDMEDAGHAVDWEALREQEAYAEPFKEYMTQAARDGLARMAHKEVDYTTLNLNSAPQMRTALYEDLGLSTTRKTKGGALSTDAIALEGLSHNHPAVKKLLEVREVGNLAGRLKKWSQEYSQTYDKRVHPSFNQVVVGSGRFSANDPSIQQLPKSWGWHSLHTSDIDFHNPDHVAQLHAKAVFGKHYWMGNFRDFLIAGEGSYLLGFDWSQIELRVLAGLSGEPALLDAFNTGKDVHTATASQMLHIAYEEVQKHERAKGKTLNFGLVYQMGVGLLAEQLGISESEAQDLYDAYFRAFTRVGEWFAYAKHMGKMAGYAETYFGRKWTLWDLQSNNFVTQGKGERLCVNAPCQGTAADYAKYSMAKCQQVLQEKGWWMTKVRLINNLHDALTFEVDNSVNPEELRNLLLPCVTWEIPSGASPLWKQFGPCEFPKMEVEWEIGQRWGSSKVWHDESVSFTDGHWQLGEAPEKSPAPILAAAPEPEPEPKEEPELIVELLDMPSPQQYQNFIKVLQDNPGERRVRLVVPEGEAVLKWSTDLSARSHGPISWALGDVKVYEPREVDLRAMAEGLGL